MIYCNNDKLSKAMTMSQSLHSVVVAGGHLKDLFILTNIVSLDATPDGRSKGEQDEYLISITLLASSMKSFRLCFISTSTAE